jgi:CDP-glucose 4,6-dehydratase
MNNHSLVKIYKNKKILITGHTGFKGSWLTLWLLNCGANIMGISNNIPTNPSLFKILNLEKKIIDKRLDIRDLKKIKREINKFKPDFLFHLAAQSLVKKSYHEPYNTWTSNTLGTINILESLKSLKKKCIAIIITSDKSYKNIETKRGYVETDALGGYDPYSASKASAELALQSYIKSFFHKNKCKVHIGIARAGNVIGGGDWSEDRLVPDCIRSWSKNKTVVIRNPNSTRPWQHVMEAISGYLTLGAKIKKNAFLHGEVFNFGPNNRSNYKVISLVKQMQNSWKKIKWIKSKGSKDRLESKLLKINSNKAKKILNWRCILNFNETASFVSKWYETYFNGRIDMYEFTSGQIKSYLNISKKN